MVKQCSIQYYAPSMAILQDHSALEHIVQTYKKLGLGCQPQSVCIIHHEVQATVRCANKEALWFCNLPSGMR